MKIKSRTFANFLSVVTIGYVVLRGVTISDILSEKFSDGAVWIEERYDLMLLLPLLVSSFIKSTLDIPKPEKQISPYLKMRPSIDCLISIASILLVFNSSVLILIIPLRLVN